MHTMLTDERFSPDRQQQSFPCQVDGQPGSFRRAVTGGFTLKRIKEMRPDIQQLVDDCTDAMPAGSNPADLVAALPGESAAQRRIREVAYLALTRFVPFMLHRP
ncbi:hypothetical protein ACH4E8_19100 [Streptomyces sp. NPDC017979]|uniref:hypothetical protein n=1 Tax=Streptomyces sp. NPDC017979 TaxID=3365024 RepID=UPI0037960416